MMRLEAVQNGEDVAVAKLTTYVQAQEIYIDYLCLANECDKLFTAVEACDDMLDYIDFYTETRVFADDSDADEDALCSLLGEVRARTLRRFENLLKELRKRVCDELFVTPTLADLQSPLLAYLHFKEEVNTVSIAERAARVPLLAGQLRETLASFPNDSLDKLLQNAVGELEDAWPREFAAVRIQYGEDWHQEVTYGERLLLEQHGVFPYRQDHGHRVFQHQATVAETPDGATRKSKWVSWLHRRASGGSVLLWDVKRRREVYRTPSLDRYLCIRDMYQNTYRKFARALPITMNQYLIKTYEEPAFWGASHSHLGQLDLGRLGLGYFKQAMDLGRNSAYAKMLLRYALQYFRQARIFIPDHLVGQID